jgi:hypothetical protein
MKRNLLFVILVILSVDNINAQVDFVWGKQFGTEKDDKTRNLVANSSGDIYVLGKTKGKIGKENFGKNDGFVTKIDSVACTVWSIQIGSEEEDELKHAAIDKSGNLYVTGFIGTDAQNSSVSNSDILVVKLRSNGEIVWQKQYGTDSIDIGENIVVFSNGDIYITGTTRGSMGSTPKGKDDCFILRLDSLGNQLVVVQFGTAADDMGLGITVGADSYIYLCGATKGNLAAKNGGKFDLFWAIFSKELKQQNVVQYGTSENDYAGEIKTDSKNNVYIAGNTDGDMASKQIGNSDAFFQKWNGKGYLAWTKQFGTNNWDGAHSIAIIRDNRIVISGCYDYPLCKSFIKMYDEQGNLLWNRNIVAQGKGGGSCGKDVCVNRQGYIYHAGYTGANLFSELKGEHDLFLVKLRLKELTANSLQ